MNPVHVIPLTNLFISNSALQLKENEQEGHVLFDQLLQTIQDVRLTDNNDAMNRLLSVPLVKEIKQSTNDASLQQLLKLVPMDEQQWNEHQQIENLQNVESSKEHTDSRHGLAHNPQIWMNHSIQEIIPTPEVSGRSNEGNKATTHPANHSFLRFYELIEKVEKQEVPIEKIAPKILSLVRESFRLEEHLRPSVGTQLQHDQTKTETKILGLWRELQDMFQKRTHLASRHIYHQTAELSSKDVTKWMEHALRNIGESELVETGPKRPTVSIMPTSKLEQYVVHTYRNHQPVEQQVINQMNRIIKISGFMSHPNGNQQLSIALRPEHLGEMSIKFIQLDGEMTVHIIAQSKVTKELLESNMHQLRHMFAPHQITIERQDLQEQQYSDTDSKEQEQQSFEEQHEDSREQSSNHSEEKTFKSSFDETLNEIYLNEKV